MRVFASRRHLILNEENRAEADLIIRWQDF